MDEETINAIYCVEQKLLTVIKSQAEEIKALKSAVYDINNGHIPINEQAAKALFIDKKTRR